MLRALAAAGLLASAAANAQDFDWNSPKNRTLMDSVFAGDARVCAALFGYTLLPREAGATEKLDAYLLLHDSPDEIVQGWARDILAPLNAVMSKTEGDHEADHLAASAAAAAAEDPSTYAEAKARYMQGAMAPFNRALGACDQGVRDPYLGTHYWTGRGSSAKIEADIDAFFAKLVAHSHRIRK